MREIEVVICKGGREIDRVRRPVHQSAEGPCVTYRRRRWPLKDGMVNLDGETVGEENRPVGEEPAPPSGPDPVQLSIINCAASDRLLVDAGPGTGKTHVACARVAALIKQGIQPSRIWLISFTRTAVLEIRQRIASALDEPGDAATVCIATLDSHAWALQSGFSTEARITGSFDENIEATLRKLQTDEDLREYLATRVRHLIIDEAQDIVGVRAELSVALIHGVAEDCGVTVFADEAQAIYGFSEETDSLEPEGRTFVERLRAEGFEEISLSTVYRTGRANLASIFTGLRKKVLRRAGSAKSRREQIEEGIRKNADSAMGSLRDATLKGVPGNGLVLARRRIDVLVFSSMQAEIPHRLRLSGLPPCLKPWIAQLFWDWVEPLITRQQFEQRWGERDASALPGSPSDREAWQLLVEVAGRSATMIELSRFRKVLGRTNPPMLFCTPEFGFSGPIVGTIHASKGREADHVALYLPRARDDEGVAASNMEEEIRVLFVGATRARKFLSVGHSPIRGGFSKNGRAWRVIRPSGRARRIQVEVGRMHDVRPEGLVGRAAFSGSNDALSAQHVWKTVPVRRDLFARAEQGLGWEFEVIVSGTTQRLAVLDSQVRNDLYEIARDCNAWPPPNFIPHLRTMGVRSLVLAPDDSCLQQLHEPWRTSGIMSAPLLIGFSSCKLGDSSWRKR